MTPFYLRKPSVKKRILFLLAVLFALSFLVGCQPPETIKGEIPDEAIGPIGIGNVVEIEHVYVRLKGIQTYIQCDSAYFKLDYDCAVSRGTPVYFYKIDGRAYIQFHEGGYLHLVHTISFYLRSM